VSRAPQPRPPAEESERARAGRAARGDAEAFAVVFHRHRAVVYRVARSVLGDHEAARDALQDTFLKVHRSLGAWKGEATLRTWIVRIALRTAIDQRRRNARRPRGDSSGEPSHDPRAITIYCRAWLQSRSRICSRSSPTGSRSC